MRQTFHSETRFFPLWIYDAKGATTWQFCSKKIKSWLWKHWQQSHEIESTNLPHTPMNTSRPLPTPQTYILTRVHPEKIEMGKMGGATIGKVVKNRRVSNTLKLTILSFTLSFIKTKGSKKDYIFSLLHVILFKQKFERDSTITCSCFLLFQNSVFKVSEFDKEKKCCCCCCCWFFFFVQIFQQIRDVVFHNKPLSE